MYYELLVEFLALMTTCSQSNKIITSVHTSIAEHQRHQTYHSYIHNSIVKEVEKPSGQVLLKKLRNQVINTLV
jgi:hypothetical protein